MCDAWQTVNDKGNATTFLFKELCTFWREASWVNLGLQMALITENGKHAPMHQFTQTNAKMHAFRHYDMRKSSISK
jgi:hypothetical protein